MQLRDMLTIIWCVFERFPLLKHAVEKISDIAYDRKHHVIVALDITQRKPVIALNSLYEYVIVKKYLIKKN